MRQPHADDYVRLVQDIPDLALHRGEVGVVRSIWFAPQSMCEVEFHHIGHDVPIRTLLSPQQIAVEPRDAGETRAAATERATLGRRRRGFASASDLGGRGTVQRTTTSRRAPGRICNTPLTIFARYAMVCMPMPRGAAWGSGEAAADRESTATGSNGFIPTSRPGPGRAFT